MSLHLRAEKLRSTHTPTQPLPSSAARCRRPRGLHRSHRGMAAAPPRGRAPLPQLSAQCYRPPPARPDSPWLPPSRWGQAAGCRRHTARRGPDPAGTATPPPPAPSRLLGAAAASPRAEGGGGRRRQRRLTWGWRNSNRWGLKRWTWPTQFCIKPSRLPSSTSRRSRRASALPWSRAAPSPCPAPRQLRRTWAGARYPQGRDGWEK